MSYHSQVGHYKSQNAPNKWYLELYLTITAMLEDNKLTHGDISYIVYQRVFQLENTGFGKSSKDECDICAKYKAHCKDLDGAHDVDACEQCKGGQEHQKKTEEARIHYRENQDKKTDNTSIFTVDMQKVILLPKMTLKEHFLSADWLSLIRHLHQ